MFNLKILDMKKEYKLGAENRIEYKCYLSSASLRDYIENLPSDFDHYEIQRQEVNNKYLSNLIDSVINERNIPPIILFTKEYSTEEREKAIQLTDYRILDGFQRTSKLKVIWDTYKFLIKKLNKSTDIENYTKIKLARMYNTELFEINSSAQLLYKLIQEWKKDIYNNDIGIFEKKFFNNKQWFEVWCDLDIEAQVEKMLILNAGHKSVSMKHQLELVFINILNYLKEKKNTAGQFLLIREKEKPFVQFVKDRKKGEFHFSSIIASVLSFAATFPIVINADLVEFITTDKMENKNEKKESYFDVQYEYNYFNYDFLDKIIDFLIEMDNILYSNYGDLGIKWLAKESVLVGLFSALGFYYKNHMKDKSPEDSFNFFVSKLNRNIRNLNLEKFDEARIGINISKVNIGTMNKKVVYYGMLDFLNDEEVLWDKLIK